MEGKLRGLLYEIEAGCIWYRWRFDWHLKGDHIDLADASNRLGPEIYETKPGFELWGIHFSVARR